MNLDLELKNGPLSFTSDPDIMEGILINKEPEQEVSIPGLPSLKDILKEIGPFPKEALFLGLAEDGKPVLLNLEDPTPGPILLIGDSNSAKTEFLKAIARFVFSTHQSRELQYGVITGKPDEWDNLAEYHHCIGIFSSVQKSATDFIRALAAWIDMKNMASRQPVLFLIDDFDNCVYWNNELRLELQKILLYGPAKNIWPIATINHESFQNANTWFQYFRTQVFGYTNCIEDNEYPYTGFETLCQPPEYCLKVRSQWIKFRIPIN